MPAVPAVALPTPTFAGGRRVVWSVLGGYLRFVARVAVVATCGIVLNWGFLALAAWRFGLFSAGVFWGTALVVAFGLGFPFAFLVVGQKQGIQILLRHCYQRHESTLIDFVLLVLQRVLTANDGSGTAIGADTIRSALKRVHEMPWAIRFALKRYLMHEKFQALALEIIGDPDFRSGNLGAVKSRYSGPVTECVLATMLTVDKGWFWTLAGVNSAAIVAVWLLRTL